MGKRTGLVSEADSKVELPPRYHSRWQQPFEDRVGQLLREDMTVLDVGSSAEIRPWRSATVRETPAMSGWTCRPASWSGQVPARMTTSSWRTRHARAALRNTIDLAISWQVFEHVKPLDQAFDNLHSYLLPGGMLVSLFSGKRSAFGVLNQLIPNAIGTRLVERTMRRRGTDDPAFPAFYDRCSDRGLREMTSQWTSVEIRGSLLVSRRHVLPLLTRPHAGVSVV